MECKSENVAHACEFIDLTERNLAIMLHKGVLSKEEYDKLLSLSKKSKNIEFDFSCIQHDGLTYYSVTTKITRVK